MRKLTVGMLLQVLEGLDEETEIRFAHQPNWPFEYAIDDTVVVTEINGTEIVYLAEKHQIGYLPGEVSRELGWRE